MRAVIQLYDTARREVVPFAPDTVVRMYVCGITPYDSTHLGHAATYLTYDILTRRLEELGHEVRMVRNVTDVDDSILPEGPGARRPVPRARRGGDRPVPLGHGRARHAPADRRAARDRDDRRDRVDRRAAARLRARVPDRAAPRTSTSRRSSASAQLSQYSRDQMVRLARARGGNPDDPHRRDPLDFVLWQPSLAGRARVARAVRRRPARLAHRVLGHVDAGARPDARPARRRHRPDLPAPRVRGRAERGADRQAVRAPLAALGDGRATRARR